MKPSILLAALSLFAAAPLAQAAEPQLAHMVYFKLKDSSGESKQRLVAACRKYLSDHEGTVYFSAGVLADDLNRDVNDRDFDVSLNVVFRNRAAHDEYQTHPRHLQFIEENKETWAKVRVFDSYLPAAKDDKDKRIGQRVPLPDPASFFAGMIQGEVVEVRKGQIVLKVSAVTKQWKHSRAKNADAMIGKNVLVDGNHNDRIARFVKMLEVGANVTLDVAHKEGEVLNILELTEDQRERVK